MECAALLFKKSFWSGLMKGEPRGNWLIAAISAFHWRGSPRKGPVMLLWGLVPGKGSATKTTPGFVIQGPISALSDSSPSSLSFSPTLQRSVTLAFFSLCPSFFFSLSFLFSPMCEALDFSIPCLCQLLTIRCTFVVSHSPIFLLFSPCVSTSSKCLWIGIIFWEKKKKLCILPFYSKWLCLS